MCIQENIKRLREITDSMDYAAPFRDTIIGDEIKDSANGSKAIMHYIFKDEDAAIVMVDIEAGFLHRKHFHQEKEILTLLRGQAYRVYDDGEEELAINVPVILSPLEQHTMFYPMVSKVLAITIPASRHFPNKPITDGDTK